MPAGESLPDTGSPWRLDPQVRIPFVLWRRLVDAIEQRQPSIALVLRGWSRDDADDDRIEIERAHLRELTKGLRQVHAMAPRDLPLLREDPDAPSPDFDPEEYMRILSDVLTVLDASLESGRAFSAWLE